MTTTTMNNILWNFEHISRLSLLQRKDSGAHRKFAEQLIYMSDIERPIAYRAIIAVLGSYPNFNSYMFESYIKAGLDKQPKIQIVADI